MKMTGKSGKIMVGGRIAATLADWTLEPRSGGGSDIVASTAARDAFWFEHGGPFDLVLEIGAHERRYENVRVHDCGDLVNIKTREA